jgi:pyruvate kinase
MTGTRARRTKIVATLGPASRSAEMIRALAEAGADVFRLNFSHGAHADHAEAFRAIRALEADLGRPIGVLQDLQGPKIRIGDLPAGPMAIREGDRVRFSFAGGQGAIALPHRDVFAALMPGHRLLIDDGRAQFRVQSLGPDSVEAEALNAATLSDRKGVNLPDTVLELSPLTEKDRADLAFGLELGVDWVALSFVQRPADLIELKALVGDRAGLLAKIEKPSALAQLDDIVRLADAVMVARGDLGVEIPPEEVPQRQKQIVRACRAAAKPVIVATQMLESMVHAPTPTRAEASDVAAAVYDGADAVMLSAESASGAYPREAVAMMARIVERAEADRLYRPISQALAQDLEVTPAHAISAAAAALADDLQAAAIAAFTARGVTALRIARARPNAPVLALTPDVAIARRLCLAWGIASQQAGSCATYDEMVHSARLAVDAAGLARPPQPILAVAGFPFGASGGTNTIRVIT